MYMCRCVRVYACASVRASVNSCACVYLFMYMRLIFCVCDTCGMDSDDATAEGLVYYEKYALPVA